MAGTVFLTRAFARSGPACAFCSLLSLSTSGTHPFYERIFVSNQDLIICIKFMFTQIIVTTKLFRTDVKNMLVHVAFSSCNRVVSCKNTKRDCRKNNRDRPLAFVVALNLFHFIYLLLQIQQHRFHQSQFFRLWQICKLFAHL